LAYPAASGDGPSWCCCKSRGCPCRRPGVPRPRRRCGFRTIRVPRRPPRAAHGGTGRPSRSGSGTPSSRRRSRVVTRLRRECVVCGSAESRPSASRRRPSAPRPFASGPRALALSSGSRAPRFRRAQARATRVFRPPRRRGMTTLPRRTTYHRRPMATRQDRSRRRTRWRAASPALPRRMRRTRRNLLLPRISRRRTSTRRLRRKSRHVRGAEPRA
jgi:hypothetical protein